MPSRFDTIAVYKGDDLLCMGTISECAAQLKIKPETIRFYTTPAYRRRVENRGHTSGNIRAVVTT